MLKGCARSICEPLSELFNKSLSAGTVPDDWKISSITPIHKGGDASLTNNYRPISLLSLISKLLERLVHQALLGHVLEHGYLSPKQYGFRPGSSTMEAVLSATYDWHASLEKAGSVACVFFDISKAFDALPHSFVLSSLANVGVCGALFEWFCSYLSGQRQQVVLNGTSSPVRDVSSGVPQGSILGPLLFILSVNSIISISLSPNAIISLFADDMLLYKEVLHNLDLLAFQSDVSLVVDWVRSMGLKLNSWKTKCLMISRKRCLGSEESIEQVQSFRYLGVFISSDLCWSQHIHVVCCKAHRLLGFLYRSLVGGDVRTLSCLYKTLVLPVLGYCSPVWDPQQKGLLSLLDRVQGFAARLVTGRWSADWSLLCSELGWCPIAQRRKCAKINYVGTSCWGILLHFFSVAVSSQLSLS